MKQCIEHITKLVHRRKVSQRRKKTRGDYASRVHRGRLRTSTTQGGLQGEPVAQRNIEGLNTMCEGMVDIGMCSLYASLKCIRHISPRRSPRLDLFCTPDLSPEKTSANTEVRVIRVLARRRRCDASQKNAHPRKRVHYKDCTLWASKGALACSTTVLCA